MKALDRPASPTATAYSELQAAFEHYNTHLFDGQLPHCLITMQREKRTYGYFSSRRFANRHDKTMTDEIAMNPSYFGVVPLLEILQTLVHEMAHLWQFHFGDPGRRGYHNKEWADKMEAIGLMPSDTGKPGGKKTGEKMADYAIEDGPFMQATDVLLATDFRISWFDRHPPAGTEIAAIFGEAGNGEDNDSGGMGGLLEPVTAGNKSNRDKYRCPVCAVQVWGKPGLKLMCGGDDCDGAVFELAIN
ncbi:SprT-like domain-containing protein [Pseudomonas aeruginosa]|uniref:SprT-like domain-containing protein n=1 Tax=Pseudomonas aeruginosa TaxID=287 RepID=UPI0021E12C47|nr:SprT-like domain-containing protein [Pseudomonas aeruginosa]EIY9820475.1 SprT-like domain-containing protein [Escherichia coli]ELV0329617.1 SprT-like domain-containing protein [Salmonella enterica]EMA0231051.1 SprT-like domain-containing protein [Salmonella enterica]MCV0297705.1 SprT-like domain-containing protein [Pseudomonas aeruginosa]